MKTKKKYIGLLVAALALALCMPMSYAWYTSTVDPITADITTAKIEIVGEDEWTVDTANYLPGDTAGLDAVSITNNSTREIIVRVDPKIDGYLKFMEAPSNVEWRPLAVLNQDTDYLFIGNQGAGYYNVPANVYYYGILAAYTDLFLDGNADGTAWGVGDTWRAKYPIASSYILGNAADPFLYLRVDDDFIAATSALPLLNWDNNMWRMSKLGYGMKHFNAVSKYMKAGFAQNMITSFVDAIGGDVSTIDFNADIVYDDGNYAVYLDSATGVFYIWVEPGNDIEFGALGVKIPEELGGGTGHAYHSWLNDPEYNDGLTVDDPSGDYSLAYDSLDQNAGLNPNAYASTDYKSTRLNEQGAMFQISLNAKAVQGTYAAALDIYGQDVADAFVGWYR